MPNPFSRKRKIVRQAPDAGAKKSTRVKLRPGSDWTKRNFITSVWIPTLFTKRSGAPARPLFPKVQPGQICITWIGHASFLVQTHDANVLIDPIWSMWLSVIKRIKEPGFHIHHLPSIDFVLVTHAHFDHLDRRTLRKVAADQPIVVPVGVGRLVHRLGFNIVHELDEWQAIELGRRGPLTPAHRGRALSTQRLRRLSRREWSAAFSLRDSAYFEGFKEIGERHNIEIALLPIGAYDPPLAREVHMNPEEAVRAFNELKAKTLVPMHYGSFRLGYEPLEEPLERLRESARVHGIEDKVLVMTEGKPVVL